MGRPAGWMKELTGRSPMMSPGAPTHRREVEREFWRRIATGVTSEAAAAAVDVSQAVGSRWFRRGGGMPPMDLNEPAGRYLSFAEREEIALLRARNYGVRAIAREIGRDPSTVSRELRRNAATRGGKPEYRASVAQWKAELIAKRPKACKLVENPKLRAYVQDRLAGEVCDANGRTVGPEGTPWIGRNKPHRGDRRWTRAWSPEQISNRLRVDFPDDETMRISHEAIYQALYIEGRGALKRELVHCLRTGRALRVPRARAAFDGMGARDTRGDDLRTSRRSRRPLGPRSLGGRSDHRVEALGDRHDRRPLDPVHDAHPSPERSWLRHNPENEERASACRLRSRHDGQSTRDIDVDTARPAHADRSPGTGARNSPPTLRSPSRPASRCSSPTRTAPGSAARTRTRTDCCASTSPRGPTCPAGSDTHLDAVAAELNSRPRKILGWRTPAEAFDDHLRSVQQAGVATTD